MKIDKSPVKNRRILVAISGSIAAVKTPLLVSSLVKAGAHVKCVVTPSASKLVSTISLASLSRSKCYEDNDQWSSNEPKPLHIALAEWAELIVIAPLSASSLARWTQGLADGLLASILLASECPVIAAAAMNTAMWSNEAVKNNWKLLQSYINVIPLEPASGILACDRIGAGKMVDTDLIEIAIESAINQNHSKGELFKDWNGKKLIVTAGPTYEAIDQARLITNRSSGKMGVMLAQAARFRGADVQLLHGPLKIPKGWIDGLKTYQTNTSLEMQSTLARLQPDANAIAMAAAVADFRKKGSPENQKLSKEKLLASLGDFFEPVPDLLAELINNRPSGQTLLGFSALTGLDTEIKKSAAEKKLLKGCDLLMANPIDRPGAGFEENLNGGFLFGPNNMVKEIPITTKMSLAHQLLDEIIALQVNISDSIE